MSLSLRFRLLSCWAVATLALLLSFPARAQNVCSRSEQLYGAAKDAGVGIHGVYVTLPAPPAWDKLMPLYRLLKDHDPGVNDGDCRKMIKRLKDAVVERVERHGTFLRVQLDDRLNRLRGDRVIELDGNPVAAVRTSVSGAESATGYPVLNGIHTVKLRGVTVQPGERLLIEGILDEQSLGKGEATEFRVNIPPAASPGRRILTLRVAIGVVRECKVRLRVGGNLFDALKPGDPRYIVELSQTDLVTKQFLQRGDYPLTAGDYALSVMLQDGEAAGPAPRMLLDDAQVGLRASNTRSVPTWQYGLRLECPPDAGFATTTVELSVPGRKRSNAVPFTEKRAAEASSPPPPARATAEATPAPSKQPAPTDAQASAGQGLPVLTWVGVGVAGAGLLGTAVGYFGVYAPNDNASNDLYAERGCNEDSPRCGPESRTRLERLWDARDLGGGIAIGSAITCVAGATLAVAAWLLDERAPKNVALRWVPGGSAGGGVVQLVGRF